MATTSRLLLAFTIIALLQLGNFLAAATLSSSSSSSSSAGNDTAASCLFVGCTCIFSLLDESINIESVNCDAEQFAEFPLRNWQYRTRGSGLEISLSRNDLTRVPAGIFAHLDVTRLDLSENKLQVVHKHAFEPLRDTVQILVLSGNGITRLDAFTFANFTKLVFLRLDSNQIRFVHPDAFANCVAILHLDLSSNRLTHIPPRLFYSLVSLEYIELHSQTNEAGVLHISDYAFERDASSQSPSRPIDLLLGRTGARKSLAVIRFAPRAFCSSQQHSNNNNLGRLSSSFANIGYIQLNHGPDALHHFNSCLFTQLEHSRQTRLMNGELSWRASACECPPLTLEEEHSFCAGEPRDHELGDRQRACWTSRARKTTTTTTSKTSPSTTTTTTTPKTSTTSKTISL